MKTTSYTLLLLSAILTFALNFLLNLATTFLAIPLEPYKSWLYAGLGIVFIASLILLVIDARRAHPQPSATITQTAQNGGKISHSPITATVPSHIDQAASDNPQITESPINVQHAAAVTLHNWGAALLAQLPAAPPAHEYPATHASLASAPDSIGLITAHQFG